MTDRPAPPLGGPEVAAPPSTLEELCAAVADLSLRLRSDPVEAGRRCRMLLAAAPEVLSDALTEATDLALALPGMTGTELARLWGVHRNKIYLRASVPRKTPS